MTYEEKLKKTNELLARLHKRLKRTINAIHRQEQKRKRLQKKCISADEINDLLDVLKEGQ